MIFQHTWEAVLAGRKTQTRRLVKGKEWYSPVMDCVMTSQHNGRMKWWVGQTYAVQPGRGQKAVGRIKLLAIRMERLQAISEADAQAEGCELEAWPPGDDDGPTRFRLNYRGQYRKLWDSIYTAPGTRWADSPLVWVLEFELVRGETGT